MLSLAEAQQRINALIKPLAAETVPLSHALGRIAAEPFASPIDLPIFDNSAMDGYAVQARDLAGASPARPIALRLIDRIAAGQAALRTVGPAQCVRLFTGSPVPPGANAVVMQEDTQSDPSQPDQVLFLDSVKPGENIRRRGEDITSNAVLLRAGDRLTVGRICLLAASGVAMLRVARRPSVALLATGSELQEAGQPLAPGQVYECNRTALATLMPTCGAIGRVFPLVSDTLEATTAALDQAFHECDVVLTSGGVSVGELDWVKAAFQQLGGELEFWRVNIRPGKPFAFGRWREKYLFGLPGNPVSALVTFQLLVRPALARLQGASVPNLPAHPGLLAEDLRNIGDRPHFMRVAVDDAGRVRSAGQQASHALSSLAACNGLVEIPPGKILAAGSQVEVLRWE
jgi:molybdopterin molybdotransferase